MYQKNIEVLFGDLLESFGLEKLPSMMELAKQVDITSALSRVAGSLTVIAGNTGIILIYVIFLLLEQRSMESKLDALFREPGKRTKIHEILSEIQKDIEAYIAIKTLLSVATGLLSYIILIYIGVDYSEFWAFLIFLLNYIPTIGSLIATIFPALLALIQFESFTSSLIVFVSIALIQFIIGNIIEPKMMGRSLNLSALVVLLSLALWGSIWGVVGMFLCVPLTVILMIIFTNFEKTRPIAVMLSANGKIDKIR
jgi:predicted PurR-regulated permease PerM